MPAPAPDGCKAIAVHGRALVDAAPAGERDQALRPVVGAIDLCQRPGLVAASRACVLAAPTIAELRACPLVTEDVAHDDPTLSCDAAVEHAMALLKVDGSLPRTREGRAHARAAYVDGCAALDLEGRRCVIDARTISAVDECFADASHLRGG